MNKINFINNSAPDLSAETLNQMQDNMEEVGVTVSPTEPTTGEKVWIDNTNNILYIKNDNRAYEEFYNESKINKTNYSTGEQVIGTWIDGKPLYRKTIKYYHSEQIGEKGALTNYTIPHNISNLKLCVNKSAVTHDGYTLPTIYSETGTTINSGNVITKVDSENINLRIINDFWVNKTWYFTLEYIKTTD